MAEEAYTPGVRAEGGDEAASEALAGKSPYTPVIETETETEPT
jgi:hypothetical protein